jgi:hypothetical protein
MNCKVFPKKKEILSSIFLVVINMIIILPVTNFFLYSERFGCARLIACPQALVAATYLRLPPVGIEISAFWRLRDGRREEAASPQAVTRPAHGSAGSRR